MTDDDTTDDTSVDVSATDDVDGDSSGFDDEYVEEREEEYESTEGALDRARLAIDSLEDVVEEEGDDVIVLGFVAVMNDPDQEAMWAKNHHATPADFDDLPADALMTAVETYNEELVDNAFKVGLADVLEGQTRHSGGGGADLGALLAQMGGDGPAPPR